MTKEYLIRTRNTKTLDEDRLDEYLKASFNDEFVEVVDRQTGEIVVTHGEDPIPFICPACDEPAYSILTSAGTKKYWHLDNETCDVDTREINND